MVAAGKADRSAPRLQLPTLETGYYRVKLTVPNHTVRGEADFCIIPEPGPGNPDLFYAVDAAQSWLAAGADLPVAFARRGGQFADRGAGAGAGDGDPQLCRAGAAGAGGRRVRHADRQQGRDPGRAVLAVFADADGHELQQSGGCAGRQRARFLGRLPCVDRRFLRRGGALAARAGRGGIKRGGFFRLLAGFLAADAV